MTQLDEEQLSAERYGQMSGIKTATVEALTAEVRVLMVGSRQITLSVVRQLDEASPYKIKPFGRVRAARKPRAGGIEVVGSADGTLAYSECFRDVLECSPGSIKSRCENHHQVLLDSGLDPKLQYIEYETATGDIGWYSTHPYPGNRVERYMERPAWWWKRHNWFSYWPDQQTWAEWENLPLIVLAGLR